MGFSETNSQKKRPISREFHDKFQTNFPKKQLLKKPISRKFSDKFRYKAIGFALISRTFLMKQNGNFANFFGGGGGGNDEH